MRLFQTTYRDRGGKQRTASRWYVEFRWAERVRRLPAFTDKRASEAFMRQLDKLMARRIPGEQPDLELTACSKRFPSRCGRRWGLLGYSTPTAWHRPSRY